MRSRGAAYMRKGKIRGWETTKQRNDLEQMQGRDLTSPHSKKSIHVTSPLNDDPREVLALSMYDSTSLSH